MGKIKLKPPRPRSTLPAWEAAVQGTWTDSDGFWAIVPLDCPWTNVDWLVGKKVRLREVSEETSTDPSFVDLRVLEVRSVQIQTDPAHGGRDECPCGKAIHETVVTRDPPSSQTGDLIALRVRG